jgi:hypothetical protein
MNIFDKICVFTFGLSAICYLIIAISQIVNGLPFFESAVLGCVFYLMTKDSIREIRHENS